MKESEYLDSNLTSHAQVPQHVAVFKKKKNKPEEWIIWRVCKKKEVIDYQEKHSSTEIL